MAASQSALILGATGQTGRHLLQALLASPHFTRVGEYGRRVTSPDNIVIGKEKLEQKVIDFEKLEDAGLQDGKWDVVYITLGITRRMAGTAENFEKIDREYVLNAAQHARSADSTHLQRIVYVSAGSANSTSRFLYFRSKGMTEEGLANLGYSDAIFFRPGLLKGAERAPAETRVVEKVAGVITGFLSYFWSGIEVQIPTLARAVYLAGRLGSENLPPAAQAQNVEQGSIKFMVISNSGSVGLGEAKDLVD